MIGAANCKLGLRPVAFFAELPVGPAAQPRPAMIRAALPFAAARMRSSASFRVRTPDQCTRWCS